MICFLEGVLEEKQPTRVALRTGGVGYEAHIPLSSFDRLPAEGQTCRLLIHDWVRDDAHVLYGFVTQEERRLFLLLLGARGIGPKIALSALSGMSPRALTAAIAEGDVKRLSSIHGIGKKTAERMVVDLRDKLAAGEALEAAAGADPASAHPRRRDAALALISLGYKQADAIRLVRAVLPESGPDPEVEEIVRLALIARG